MNAMRLWAYVCNRYGMLLLILCTTLSVAEPAGAAQSQPPSSTTDTRFNDWREMHRDMYDSTINGLLEGCYNAVASRRPEQTWLNANTCLTAQQKIEASECKNASVKDDFLADIVMGREGALKTGDPKAYFYMKKATGRLDRALWCDLGNNVHLVWFTGAAESCNNPAFVHHVPKPPPAPKEEAVSAIMLGAPSGVKAVGGEGQYIPASVTGCGNDESITPGTMIQGTSIKVVK